MRLLDLYCKAGGSSMGYHLAGFEVVGVDIEPQKHFPFEFHQADALEYLAEHWHEFDAFAASPPCQFYAKTKFLSTRNRPDLIAATRTALRSTGKRYVIENVPSAPLINPVVLNGAMFGMLIHRERWFECNFELPLVLLPQNAPPVRMGRQVREGEVIQPVGHFTNVEYAKRQMGIDWMNQTELSQAIPPAYTLWIEKQLISALENIHA